MRLDQEIDELKEELIASVQNCIQLASVKDIENADSAAPFGPGIRNCLEWTLKLGEKLGFTVRNFEGYAGQIEMGEGELLGILGHLDVVPAGDGWSVPPFGGQIIDGKIYGRGATDDKGPSLAALFAMKAIKNAGFPLNRRIRLILGTDEESGWRDMDYYKEHSDIPQMGFAPDAEFPLIHAEKGIINFEFVKEYPTLPHILALRGGERSNVVPDICRVNLKDLDIREITDKLSAFPFPEGVIARIESQTTPSSIQIVFQGVNAHGSTPQLGKNAVLYALRFLQTLPLSDEELQLVTWLNQHPGTGFCGEGLGVALSDEPSGKLSLNVGIMNMTSEKTTFVIDIRYPVTFNKEDVFNPIQQLASAEGYTMRIVHDQKPHYVPKDSPIVTALLSAYKDVTGQDGEAFAIGGGTYAKVMPQGVAFGPTLPGEPEIIHCPDEYISIDNLILTTKIYAQAILNLALDPSYKD
ncbi:dipeptidase PepV [Desulfitobacterium sp.]|uniref:dipeptidase PepV n=1 Tax=Desulfitobacterium sp. TaxID=49981 RepID=UPI002B1FD8DB|nr:dipeptidase PepV [Desulfitobacterium sp.]MEA4903097.1 dipeptidase PepV [Desulfitobacterium sp.]